MDLSSINSKLGEEESTEAKLCSTCSSEETGLKEIKEITQVGQEENFKSQLQKRVTGQVITKIYQAQILRACLYIEQKFF